MEENPKKDPQVPMSPEEQFKERAGLCQREIMEVLDKYGCEIRPTIAYEQVGAGYGRILLESGYVLAPKKE